MTESINLIGRTHPTSKFSIEHLQPYISFLFKVLDPNQQQEVSTKRKKNTKLCVQNIHTYTKMTGHANEWWKKKRKIKWPVAKLLFT